MKQAVFNIEKSILLLIISLLVILGVLIGFDKEALFQPQNIAYFSVYLIFTLSICVCGYNLRVLGDEIKAQYYIESNNTKSLFDLYFSFLCIYLSYPVGFVGIVFAVVASSILFKPGTMFYYNRSFWDRYLIGFIIAVVLFYFLFAPPKFKKKNNK